MKNRNIFFSVVAFVTLLCCGIFSANAIAADKPDYRLQISPLQDAFGTLEPGKTYIGEFSVQNTGNKAYSYTTEITPYSVTGQNYEADLENVTGYSEMMDWITITDGVTGEVQPNSARRVRFSISIPEDAPAGHQSAAIAVSMNSLADPNGSGIQANSRIAYFFYANIAGETRRDAKITENKIPGFIFNPPIVASSVVENNGNIYTEASYELEVREFFGDKLAYTNVTEDKNGDKVYETHVIFPETERYAEVSWEGAPMLGLFKVKQTVRIFDEEDVKEKIVFLCPIWFLAIIIIFVFVAIYWIVSRIGKRKEA